MNRRRRRRNSLLLFLAFVGAGVGIALYAQNAGFTESWRKLIEQEFAKRGYQADVGKLTLGPIQGLVAEDVRFYQERSRRTEIASIDYVILDVDLGQVLEKKLSLNSIDFQHANLSIPIDPSDPASRRLRIQNFSARAVFSEQDIEIVHANAVIHDLPVSVTGRLHRPVQEPDENLSDEEKRERSRQRKRQFERITERLGLLGEALAELEQIDLSRSARSKGLELEISGDLADISTLRSTCEIELDGLRRDSLSFERLRALIEFNGKRLSVRELLLNDGAGELRLNAEWPIHTPVIHFKLESRIDAQTALNAFFQEPIFREVVLFSPPTIRFEGDWHLPPGIVPTPLDASLNSATALPGESRPADAFPISGLGSFTCDRFISRGVIFNGFTTDFSLADSAVYCRNLRIDYKSGIAQANLLFDRNEGWRYQAELKFDPLELLPFVVDGNLRKQLTRWSFDEDSTVYIGAEGGGAALNAEGWEHRGVIDVRNGRIDGVPFEHAEADFEMADRVTTFTDLEFQTEAGSLAAAKLVADSSARSLTLDQLTSTLPLDALLRLTAPDLEDRLKFLRVGSSPAIRASGEFHFPESPGEPHPVQPPRARIEFDAPQANCQLFSQPVRLARPAGAIELSDGQWTLDLAQAGCFGGQLALTMTAPLPHPLGDGASLSGRFTFQHPQLMATPLLQPALAIFARGASTPSDPPVDPGTLQGRFVADPGTAHRINLTPLTGQLPQVNVTGGELLLDLLKGTLEGTIEASTRQAGETEGDTPPAEARPLKLKVSGDVGDPQWSRAQN